MNKHLKKLIASDPNMWERFPDHHRKDLEARMAEIGAALPRLRVDTRSGWLKQGEVYVALEVYDWPGPEKIRLVAWRTRATTEYYVMINYLPNEPPTVKAWDLLGLVTAS